MVRYFFASLVVVLFLTACGSDTATDEQVIGADVQQENAAPSDGSPLESELGFASEPDRRRFQLISLQRDADASMVECMRQAGFFYAVRPAEEMFRSGAFVGDGSRAWTIANGLGITSSFVDALATDAASSPTGADATNLDYVASLTPEQQADYDRALVGDLVAVSTPDAAPPDQGCWQDSYLDIVNLVAVIDAFEPELNSLNSRLNADPRVQGFQATWSLCMAEAGYAYPNEQALIDDVYARLLDIELVDTDGVTQIASVTELEALSTLEREAGLASFDCRQVFTAELEQLRNDYEREFLDDNRFRIAELPGSS